MGILHASTTQEAAYKTGWDEYTHVWPMIIAASSRPGSYESETEFDRERNSFVLYSVQLQIVHNLLDERHGVSFIRKGEADEKDKNFILSWSFKID